MDPSSIVGPLWEMTKCLCGCVKTEAAYVCDFEENLQSLQDKSKKLEEMKTDVEAYIEEEEITKEMQRSRQVSGWLQRVHSIQEEIKDIEDRRNKQIQNKCLSKCYPKNCMSSYKLGEKVDKILRNVDELQTEGEGICKDFKISLKHLSNAHEMPCGETVGLDLIFEKVWKSIAETDVGIIGLYGMGGVGKTTLLKKIYNELGKRSDFYRIMWVVVSKSPNLDMIMDNIRKSIGIGDDVWNRCINQDEKAAKIYDVLKLKKFVLLLDDIWERLDLDKVGVPHLKEANFQSKVLFTTRLEDVCAKMKAQRKFKVEILKEKEALELFCSKVGEETLKYDHVIPKIAVEMAQECKGLPLALTVVGSAMAGVRSVEAWEHSKNNLIDSWAAQDWETQVFSVLKFCYDRLPNETHKKCFLYCALYPEDCEIQVHILIEKWIGEGFLHNDRMRSVHDLRSYGGSIIEKLKLSCLLESVEDDIFLGRSIKMHDVIRDMALWVARDQDRNKKKVIVQEDVRAMPQANVEKWEMVERISIMGGGKPCMQSVAWTNLKTLILNFQETCVIEGLQNIQYARQLKVLELCGVKNIPAPEIGCLNLLEYLRLVALSELVSASDIWRELKNLRDLKVFCLEVYKKVDEFPLGLISNLHQLRVFSFYILEINTKEREFLEELERSSNLEELWIPINTESGLNLLFKSSKLQRCICRLHLHLRGVVAPINMPLLLATMSKMKQLLTLGFTAVSNVIDASIYDTCCLSTLRRVFIFNCNGIHHLTWLKYAPLLQQLYVHGCPSIEEVIKEEILQDDEKDRDHDNVDSIFPSLVELSLSYLPNLRSIHERVLPFPSLRSIEVQRCENLKKLPFDSNSANPKLKLVKGSQEWWDNLEWDDPASKTTFLSKFRAYEGLLLSL